MLLEFGIKDKIHQLERAGMRPNERLWTTIIRSGAAAYPALLELACNVGALHADEPECYGPLHALRLLGEVGQLEMIDTLMGLLPLELEYEDEKLPQLWAEELPQLVARLGAPAIEPLWALADDTSKQSAARGCALLALGYLTAIEPEAREPIVAGLRERLAAADDPAWAGQIVTALANLGAPESYAEVMALYRAGKIDQGIIPAGAARQLLLSASAKRLACAKHPLPERYDQHGPFPSQN